MTATNIGAVVFGVVIGWVTYRTLVRATKTAQISDLATVIGAVGGAAVTTLFKGKNLFGLYSIGLGAGFFAYLVVYWLANGKKATAVVMGDDHKQPNAGDGQQVHIGG